MGLACYDLRRDPHADADLPEAARWILLTRGINQWLGTDYRPEEVAELDPLYLDLISWVQRGLNPAREESAN